VAVEEGIGIAYAEIFGLQWSGVIPAVVKIEVDCEVERWNIGVRRDREEGKEVEG
jgi:hypothetical protein